MWTCSGSPNSWLKHDRGRCVAASRHAAAAVRSAVRSRVEAAYCGLVRDAAAGGRRMGPAGRVHAARGIGACGAGRGAWLGRCCRVARRAADAGDHAARRRGRQVRAGAGRRPGTAVRDRVGQQAVHRSVAGAGRRTRRPVARRHDGASAARQDRVRFAAGRGHHAAPAGDAHVLPAAPVRPAARHGRRRRAAAHRQSVAADGSPGVAAPCAVSAVPRAVQQLRPGAGRRTAGRALRPAVGGAGGRTHR